MSSAATALRRVHPNPPPPLCGPANGIGSSLLTRMDLEDEENVKDAVFQLRRCVTDAELAAWASQ